MEHGLGLACNLQSLLPKSALGLLYEVLFELMLTIATFLMSKLLMYHYTKYLLDSFQ